MPRIDRLQEEPAREIAAQEIVTGNARNNAYTGWFVGSFIPKQLGLRASDDVEVKWGSHDAGDHKAVAAANATATTLTILVQGNFVMAFPEYGVGIALSEPADYVLYAAGISHYWTAEDPSTVITVRWPSIVGDQVVAGSDVKAVNDCG